MSGKAKTIKASDFAAALLGCTILAGIPGAAFAQDAPAAPAQPAPAPAPAPQQHVIRSITIVGAQRLEPATIRSYL
jgi:outer membrane protein insertion porin family